MDQPATPPTLQMVKDILRLRDPRARKLALDLGLLPSHRDYTKFIVLCRSRTGSNFLRGLLNSHPNATVFGELFQNREAIHWGFNGYPQSKNLYQQFLNQPVRFIEEQIFHKMPLDTCAVGFKIFYYHAQQDPWNIVWDYLLQNPSIHVIHMKRRNILETHVSKIRAEQSGKWVNTSGKPEKIGPVTIDYETCLEDLSRTRQSEQRFDALFENHPKLEVIYEDLAQDYQAVFQRVRQFLCLPDQPIAPQTYKQSNGSLAQSIANYAELKERFRGSEWETFFED
jgi:LPS sulfotransferase NodH